MSEVIGVVAVIDAPRRHDRRGSVSVQQCRHMLPDISVKASVAISYLTLQYLQSWLCFWIVIQTWQALVLNLTDAITCGLQRLYHGCCCSTLFISHVHAHNLVYRPENAASVDTVAFTFIGEDAFVCKLVLTTHVCLHSLQHITTKFLHVLSSASWRFGALGSRPRNTLESVLSRKIIVRSLPRSSVMTNSAGVMAAMSNPCELVSRRDCGVWWTYSHIATPFQLPPYPFSPPPTQPGTFTWCHWHLSAVTVCQVICNTWFILKTQSSD